MVAGRALAFASYRMKRTPAIILLALQQDKTGIVATAYRLVHSMRWRRDKYLMVLNDHVVLILAAIDFVEADTIGGDPALLEFFKGGQKVMHHGTHMT